MRHFIFFFPKGNCLALIFLMSHYYLTLNLKVMITILAVFCQTRAVSINSSMWSVFWTLSLTEEHCWKEPLTPDTCASASECSSHSKLSGKWKSQVHFKKPKLLQNGVQKLPCNNRIKIKHYLEINYWIILLCLKYNSLPNKSSPDTCISKNHF